VLGCVVALDGTLDRRLVHSHVLCLCFAWSCRFELDSRAPGTTTAVSRFQLELDHPITSGNPAQKERKVG
jgi:hypothetical protein